MKSLLNDVTQFLTFCGPPPPIVPIARYQILDLPSPHDREIIHERPQGRTQSWYIQKFLCIAWSFERRVFDTSLSEAATPVPFEKYWTDADFDGHTGFLVPRKRSRRVRSMLSLSLSCGSMKVSFYFVLTFAWKLDGHRQSQPRSFSENFLAMDFVNATNSSLSIHF